MEKNWVIRFGFEADDLRTMSPLSLVMGSAVVDDGELMAYGLIDLRDIMGKSSDLLDITLPESNGELSRICVKSVVQALLR